GSISFSGGDGENLAGDVPYAAHVYVLNRTGNQDENHRNRARNDESFALLGHGGSFVYGDKTGDISVTAGTGIDFNGGLLTARVDGENDNGATTNFAQL